MPRSSERGFIIKREAKFPNAPTIRSWVRGLLSICKQYMLLSIGFITGWSLFLAFEIRHGFPNVQSIIRFILHSGETVGGETFSLTIGNVFFRLFGRLVTT